MIVRFKSTTPDGARFYFADEARAKAFAAKVHGQYHGLVQFESLAAFMESH